MNMLCPGTHTQILIALANGTQVTSPRGITYKLQMGTGCICGKIQLARPGEICSIESPGGLGLKVKRAHEKQNIYRYIYLHIYIHILGETISFQRGGGRERCVFRPIYGPLAAHELDSPKRLMTHELRMLRNWSKNLTTCSSTVLESSLPELESSLPDPELLAIRTG